MELLIFLLGVLTAIAGYIFSNFLLQPLREYQKIKAKIGYKLTYYSHIVTNPGANSLADEAAPIIRDLACDLERKYLLVPFLKVMIATKIVPSTDKIIEARGQLFFLSYSIHKGGKSSENHNALNKIFTLLGIKELVERHNATDDKGEIPQRRINETS